MVETTGGFFDVEVQVIEPALQELPSSRHRSRTTAGHLECHHASVGLFGITVEIDCLLQSGHSALGAAGLFLDLGQSQVSVETSAMEIPTDRFDPWIVAAHEKVAGVSIDSVAKCPACPLIVGRSGGVTKSTLELP
jgi:hypothetical protein